MNTTKLETIIITNESGTFSMRDIIEDFLCQLKEELEPAIIQSAFLFGSYATGLQKRESDIDICIIYDENKVSEFHINLCVDTISDALIDVYGVIIHALCFKQSYYQQNKTSSRLFLDIEKEGICIG